MVEEKKGWGDGGDAEQDQIANPNPTKAAAGEFREINLLPPIVGKFVGPHKVLFDPRFSMNTSGTKYQGQILRAGREKDIPASNAPEQEGGDSDLKIPFSEGSKIQLNICSSNTDSNCCSRYNLTGINPFHMMARNHVIPYDPGITAEANGKPPKFHGSLANEMLMGFRGKVWRALETAWRNTRIAGGRHMAFAAPRFIPWPVKISAMILLSSRNTTLRILAGCSASAVRGTCGTTKYSDHCIRTGYHLATTLMVTRGDISGRGAKTRVKRATAAQFSPPSSPTLTPSRMKLNLFSSLGSAAKRVLAGFFWVPTPVGGRTEILHLVPDRLVPDRPVPSRRARAAPIGADGLPSRPSVSSDRHPLLRRRQGQGCRKFDDYDLAWIGIFLFQSPSSSLNEDLERGFHHHGDVGGTPVLHSNMGLAKLGSKMYARVSGLVRGIKVESWAVGLRNKLLKFHFFSAIPKQIQQKYPTHEERPPKAVELLSVRVHVKIPNVATFSRKISIQVPEVETTFGHTGFPTVAESRIERKRRAEGA
ncbi:hypothetical protein FB451DRAFT_1360068 [Mycena latifolia]|nr:hypothetical protein FB451DRAFT_1360068 [Mycena latifolia]